MKNPFDLIDVRLSNIEDLILDIKHRLIGEIPTKTRDIYQAVEDGLINRQVYNALAGYHKVKTIEDFMELPLLEMRKTRGIGNKGYQMCVKAKKYYNK